MKAPREKTPRVKKVSPKRSYRAVIESLRQVWQIERVVDGEAIWSLGEPEADELDPAQIRVAVWNMCKGVGGVLFEHDFRSLCYRSDLVLAQEALLSRRSMRTFCERGWQTIHAASYKRRDGLRDGVMTSSRASALGRAQRIVCKYPEPIFRTPKVALIECFKLKGRAAPLMVINIHATLVRLIAGAVEEMEHLVSHLPEHDGPMLLAGDFNTFTPRYLDAIGRVLSRIGLEYVPIPNDPRTRTQCLDQVFCKGLDVVSVEIDTTIRNSDHFPILMRLAAR